MTRSAKTPTMIDVAQRAGVSPMTVSRAFKRDASVSDDTRRKIHAAAEALGYVFDSTASNLRSQKTGFLAVIIPSLNNANFADTVGAMTTQLRDSDLQILLGYTDYDIEEEERLVEQFLRRRPEAIVVTGGKHTGRTRRLLQNAGIPVVETWDLPEDPIDNVVGFSNAAAVGQMVDHFVARGLTRIGFIGGDEASDTRGFDRRRGFVAAMRAHGLTADRLIAGGPPPVMMREGAQAMADMLTRWPDVQAAICVSDLSGFGALTECQRRGIAVPGDISIGGFGAYDISAQCLPTLTTIDAFSSEIGRATGQLVDELLRNPARDRPAPQRIMVHPRLVVRGSG